MGKRFPAIKDFFTFYRAEFIPTTVAEWGRAMALGTSLATLFSFVYYLFKKYITESGQEATIMNLWWQFALAVFVCFVVARLVLAPYRKYRELERQTRQRIKRRGIRWRQIINKLRETHGAEVSKLRKQWDSEVFAIKAERDSLDSKVKELMAHRVTFDVNTNESQVTIHRQWKEGEEAEQDVRFYIQASFKIRFHNGSDIDQRVRQMELSLLQMDNTATERTVETNQPLTVTRVPNAERVNLTEGIEVEGGKFSKDYFFRYILILSAEYERTLSPDHFLRITLREKYQELFTLDLNVDWESVGNKNYGCILMSGHIL